MKNKILFIQEFGEAVPSGIIRGSIYIEEFDKMNLNYRFINRNSEWLVKKINNSKFIFLFKGLNQFYKIFNSIYIFFISLSYDFIWLNKVLSPKFIYLLRLFNKGKNINLDVVDNPYEISQRWINSLKYVSSVTTDNFYNQKRLKMFFSNVYIIPDYPIIHKFPNQNSNVKPKNFNFGWVGSRSSYYLLEEIEDEIIFFLDQNKDATFYLLGCPIESKLINVKQVVSIPLYDEKSMIDVISQLHVGLFPLDSTLASEVRGVLKATLYMAGKAVVLANPIGEVTDLIVHDYNGVLIIAKNGWSESLLKFKLDRDSLNRISNNAYSKLIKSYSLESNCIKLLKILHYSGLD